MKQSARDAYFPIDDDGERGHYRTLIADPVPFDEKHLRITQSPVPMPSDGGAPRDQNLCVEGVSHDADSQSDDTIRPHDMPKQYATSRTENPRH